MFKKSNLGKALAFVATICMTTILTVSASVMPANAASSSESWNFGDSSFKSLGTISSEKTINGLTLVANSSKTMSVKAENVSVNGTNFSYALALGGTGTTSYRAVKVPVTGTDTIKVTLRSSGSSARTLAVADSKGNKLGTISAATTANTVSYNYSGNAGYVYLYSTNSGINIYKVQADHYGSSSQSDNAFCLRLKNRCPINI